MCLSPHPATERRRTALETFDRVLIDEAARAEAPREHIGEGATDVPSEIARLLKEIGGRQEARTPDLRVANAALSQLS